jgi:hypothetical protein
MLDYYQRWANGPRYNPTTEFPVGVWQQDPGASRTSGTDASHFKTLGVNLYVGLWDYLSTHPTETVNAISANGARAYDWARGVAHQEVLQAQLGEDEPDGRGITPAQNQAANDQLRAADPSRPVYQNFTKGIYPGSWTTAADKRAWCASADIVSLDYYAYTDPWEDDTGELGARHYGAAVDALETYCPGKPTYAFVETSQPFNDPDRIQPGEFEAAVWNAIVHGADGITYFVHDFYTPDGGSNLWGEYGDTLGLPVGARMKTVDARLAAYAPALNAPDDTTAPASATGNVTVLTKRLANGQVWVFAQADGSPMAEQSAAVDSTVTIPGASGTVTVLDENRTVTAAGGQFTDHFGPYGFHAYRVD